MGRINTSLGLTTGILLIAFTGAAWAGDGCQTLADETFETIPPGTLVNEIVSDDFQWSGPDLSFVAEIEQGCVGDFNGDGLINGSDLAVLLIQWGTGGPADLNGDGVVNGSDLGAILTSWGACSANSANRVLQFDDSQQFGAATASAQTNQSFLPTFPNTLRLQYDSFVGSNNAQLAMRPDTSPGIFLTFFSSLVPDDHYTVFGADISAGVGQTFRTGKTTIFGEPATIFLEFTVLSKLAPPSVRILVRDSQTVAQFGDAPVEIFPAGPFGPAVTDTGVVAADPFFIPATLIKGIQFNAGGSTADNPDRLVYIDNVRFSVCPQ